MGHSFPQLPKTTFLVSGSEDSSKMSAVDQLVPLDAEPLCQKAGDAELIGRVSTEIVGVRFLCCVSMGWHSAQRMRNRKPFL